MVPYKWTRISSETPRILLLALLLALVLVLCAFRKKQIILLIVFVLKCYLLMSAA